MRFSLLISLVFIALFFISFDGEAQISTVGNEFWIGFMENNKLSNQNGAGLDYAVIIITANEDASGTIEYLGNAQAFSLSSGQQYILSIPSSDLDLLHRTSGIIENKGVYVTSNGKIAVHAFNERDKSADGTVILPVPALGKDYYITSHYETMTVQVPYNANENDESTLLVVAAEDGTQVEITPTVSTISGQTANTPYTISLNRGQSYQLKAKSDLTGTRVRVVGDNALDCKKIAVFGGNKYTSIGNCGRASDHLFQEAYPVGTWGTSFVHVALAGRSSGELVKVVASEDGTEVRVNGVLRGTIDKGKFLSLDFAANESAKIDTSKPASVTVFSKSMACNDQNSAYANVGDPFMITYSPAEQFLTDLVFNAIDLPNVVNHYVNIVVLSGEEGNTILDGQNVGGQFEVLPGDSNFMFARISISQGVHSLSNEGGFAAFIYGFGEIESYGYAAGAALDNLNFEVDSKYDFEVIGEKVACLDVEGVWTIEPENPDYTYFIWDFGDGTELVEGNDLPHTFIEPGIYEMTILASKSPNSCEEQEEIVFEVEVIEATAEIEGEQSVCPDVEEIMYVVTNQVNVFDKVFEVEGGEIIEQYADSVLVRWGEANDKAIVRVIPYVENGCPGAPIELVVVINQQIEVSDAEGELEVCYDPEVYHIYSAPNALEGRGYDWQITGGTLISGQGTSQIEVSWDQAGVEGTIQYTAYSTIDSQCEGTSAEVLVSVMEGFELNLLSATSISCNGGEDGVIELEIDGGQEPYTITWAHDPELTESIARNLGAGLYSVEVRDNLGCVQVLEDIEITEPESLSILSLETIAVSCYGKTDGVVSIEFEGGTPPYQLDKGELVEVSGAFTEENLTSGSYQWTIQDSNECLLSIQFEIESPEPLEVEVSLENAVCPGGSDGQLLAIPSQQSGLVWYNWPELASSESMVSGLSAGTYTVEVTDEEGCVSLGTGVVIEQEPTIRMPTGFDPSDGVYEGVATCEAEFQLWIYNRWGELIYFGNTGWDGKVDGELAPNESYAYVVKYFYKLNGNSVEKKLRGGFVLIR